MNKTRTLFVRQILHHRSAIAMQKGALWHHIGIVSFAKCNFSRQIDSVTIRYPNYKKRKIVSPIINTMNTDDSRYKVRSSRIEETHSMVTRRKSDTVAELHSASGWRDTTLEARPGFLIRRLHQIHVALFVEECAPEGITPVQYSILTALEQLGPSEQIALARAVGIDRASTADVIGRLIERRFIQRRVSTTDKRMKVAELTAVGRTLLVRLEERVERAHARTIDALEPADREQFMRYLRLLVETNNTLSRTPVLPVP
jgi:DNA-binding MarR family transcriptional regulator